MDDQQVMDILRTDFAMPVQRVERDQVGLSNDNWRVVLEPCPDRPPMSAFAKHYRNRTAEQVAMIEARIAAMRAAGLPAPMRIVSGAVYRGLVVHALVDGEHYRPTPGRVTALAGMWRRLIAIGGAPVIRPPRPSDHGWIDKVRVELDVWQHHPRLAERQRRTLMLLDRIEAVVMGRQLPLMIAPTHLDLHGRNMLFRGDELVLLCDWEHYGEKDRATDLAEIAAHAAAIPGPAGAIDRHLLRRFVAAVAVDVDHPPWDWQAWWALVPALAMIRHLRLMPLRFRLAAAGRDDVLRDLIDGSLRQGDDLFDGGPFH